MAITQDSLPIMSLKRNLNADFFKHAKINGLVSVIYYPGQDEMNCCRSGHSEIEVEGICYSTSCRMHSEKSLEEKIRNIAKGRLPFQRIHISVTPEQLSKLIYTFAPPFTRRN